MKVIMVCLCVSVDPAEAEEGEEGEEEAAGGVRLRVEEERTGGESAQTLRLHHRSPDTTLFFFFFVFFFSFLLFFLSLSFHSCTFLLLFLADYRMLNQNQYSC